MKHFQKIAIVFAVFIAGLPAFSQVSGSASGPLQLSVFGAGTGTWTGLQGGKNLAVTAGVDLSFRKYRGFRPAVEVRGTYPIHGGHFVSEESFLVGPKVEYAYGKFRPYGDFLIGRGAMNYQNGGYLYTDSRGITITYFQSTSTVLSPGIGIDYSLTRQWAVKGDAQYQHWNTPVTASGTLNSKVLSAGIVYRFSFGKFY